MWFGSSVLDAVKLFLERLFFFWRIHMVYMIRGKLKGILNREKKKTCDFTRHFFFKTFLYSLRIASAEVSLKIVIMC